MHFQFHPYEQTKLVRCTKGRIYDVIIDLRPDSPTYKQWIGIELSEDNYYMLYVPDNFAHGYLCLEDKCEIMYFVTQFYHPEAEDGIRWNDQQFNIDWPIEPIIISEKDKNYQDFQNELLISSSYYNYNITTIYDYS